MGWGGSCVMFLPRSPANLSPALAPLCVLVKKGEVNICNNVLECFKASLYQRIDRMLGNYAYKSKYNTVTIQSYCMKTVQSSSLVSFDLKWSNFYEILPFCDWNFKEIEQICRVYCDAHFIYGHISATNDRNFQVQGKTKHLLTSGTGVIVNVEELLRLVAMALAFFIMH